jgi:hypothetical protein
MEFITQFFQEGFWVIAVLVYIITEALKTKVLKDTSLVPLIAIALGVILAIPHNAWILGNGFTSTSIMNAIEQGVIASAIVIAGFDTIKGIINSTKKSS